MLQWGTWKFHLEDGIECKKQERGKCRNSKLEQGKSTEEKKNCQVTHNVDLGLFFFSYFFSVIGSFAEQKTSVLWGTFYKRIAEKKTYEKNNLGTWEKRLSMKPNMQVAWSVVRKQRSPCDNLLAYKCGVTVPPKASGKLDRLLANPASFCFLRKPLQRSLYIQGHNWKKLDIRVFRKVTSATS